MLKRQSNTKNVHLLVIVKDLCKLGIFISDYLSKLYKYGKNKRALITYKEFKPVIDNIIRMNQDVLLQMLSSLLNDQKLN